MTATFPPETDFDADLPLERELPFPGAAAASDARREWILIGLGLTTLVAILTAVVTVVMLVAGDDKGTTTIVREQAPRSRPPLPPRPTLADAKGVDFESSTASTRRFRGPARAGQDVRRRRLPARHPGLQGARPTEVWSFSVNGKRVPRYRRVGARWSSPRRHWSTSR